MATSRATVGSVFGAISTAATTVSNTLEAANAAIGMLNKAVDDMSYRQSKRSEFDLAIFEISLEEEKTMELATSRLAIGKWMAEDASHKDAYQSAQSDLATAIAKRKSSK